MRNFTKQNSAAMFWGRKILSGEILWQILYDRTLQSPLC